jgi:hypothetical protein
MSGQRILGDDLKRPAVDDVERRVAFGCENGQNKNDLSIIRHVDIPVGSKLKKY